MYITISNNSLTSFSDSPRYFEVKVDEETLKNVVPHSVATALASIVLPVPGGPTIRTPFQGLLIPCKGKVPKITRRTWKIIDGIKRVNVLWRSQAST